MMSVILATGHSPGSIAVHDKDNGILVTGDTLYQTDHGLIGSSDNLYPIFPFATDRLLRLVPGQQLGADGGECVEAAGPDQGNRGGGRVS